MDPRFEFALEQLSPRQWQLLEELARQFLSVEFPDLREMALPSGDKGRDDVLWRSDGDETTAVQVSTTQDWASKIRSTVRDLKKNDLKPVVLIYVSNLRIAAAADDLKQELRRSQQVVLDVRDRSWFLQRQHVSEVTIRAAEQACERLADPILLTTGLRDSTGIALESEESRVALLSLILERKDASSDRQLTKLCFDALVRGALSGTDPEHLMERSEIHGSVRRVLPTHPPAEIEMYADRALERLERVAIRHHGKSDSFCLAFDERTRLARHVADFRMVKDHLTDLVWSEFCFVTGALDVDVELLGADETRERLLRVLETFLFERGEHFCTALQTGQTMLFVLEEIEQAAVEDLARHPDTSSHRAQLPTLVARTLERLMSSPDEQVQIHLRRIADGYTVFAFLKETSNVQSAITKLFGRGEFWLDTSVILPLFVEELLPSEQRTVSVLLRAAREAGARLYVTEGVLEELDSHLRNCATAARSPSTFNSRTPFVFAIYLYSGREPHQFGNWVRTFRGSARPQDDIADYLTDEHRIEVRPLEGEVEEADETLRFAASRLWRETHVGRRAAHQIDPAILERLTKHDVECFVGVIQRRTREGRPGAFGFESWWITFDRSAEKVLQQLNQELEEHVSTPCLSLDFLSQYLSVGPARIGLSKATQERLPLITDPEFVAATPSELLEHAAEVRRRHGSDPERLIQREIRDHLDAEKLRKGRLMRGGIEQLEADIRAALADA